jgi:hypothetical protein
MGGMSDPLPRKQLQILWGRLLTCFPWARGHRGRGWKPALCGAGWYPAAGWQPAFRGLACRRTDGVQPTFESVAPSRLPRMDPYESSPPADRRRAGTRNRSTPMFRRSMCTFEGAADWQSDWQSACRGWTCRWTLEETPRPAACHYVGQMSLRRTKSAPSDG